MKERIQKEIKKNKQMNYLSRDFDSYKADLLKYAKTYFPDKISDFSEASLGGLFLDMTAFVGDNLSFYLDHQFRELNPITAVETKNIESHLRNAGVKIVGSSPSVCQIKIFVEVYAIVDESGDFVPDRSLLPIIKEGTTFRSISGIRFTLIDDVDFTSTNENGELIADIVIGNAQQPNVSNGTFILSLDATCISGEETTESFVITGQFIPFRTITLTRPNVTEIISVKDSEGNVYYEVDYLTQSNVFREVKTNSQNNKSVSSLELVPAPYRYVLETNLQSRNSILRFGSGNAESLDDDIIPDPSEATLPLFGKNNFGRLSIDPNRLLDTQSLGISPVNTTITVKYRHGGGSNHNVSANSIRNIVELFREFPNAIDFDQNKYPFFVNKDFNTLASRILNTIDVTNPSEAYGGSAPPTITELQSRINSTRFLQSRIVSRQDLLARIYSLPAKFGRVYRAAVVQNVNNPSGAPLVYVISRDANGKLSVSSDILKKNLRLYLNEFRLMSDALDILDAKIINFSIKYKVLVDPSYNKSNVLQKINSVIARSIKLSNFQIGQPIIKDDIRNSIINQEGVISLVDLRFETVKVNKDNFFAGRSYSGVTYDFDANEQNGIYIPPTGGLFELKYPTSDILGSSV
jgi:hypothetical protein